MFRLVQVPSHSVRLASEMGVHLHIEAGSEANVPRLPTDLEIVGEQSVSFRDICSKRHACVAAPRLHWIAVRPKGSTGVVASIMSWMNQLKLFLQISSWLELIDFGTLSIQ